MWFEQLLPWSPLIGGIVVAAIGASVSLWVKFGGDKRAAKVPNPPTWPEMWARMDALEAEQEELRRHMDQRDAAFIEILYAIQRQWPEGYPAPVLPSEALDLLADTIPPQWQQKFGFA